MRTPRRAPSPRRPRRPLGEAREPRAPPRPLARRFGECWLKYQANPKAPLYGQRGRYSDDFRKRHWNAHRHNNLTVPTHVPWAGGVMGARVDLSVTWETGSDGGMRSSAGETIVDYRPWESKEQNLKRGVKPEQMKF